VSIQGRTRRPDAIRWLRGVLLTLLCLAVLGADSRATTLCIDDDGTAGIESAIAGRCAGCDDAPVSRPQPGSELRAAACDGCVDLDVAGVEQGARRELELVGVGAPAPAPAPHALPVAAPRLAPARHAQVRDTGSGAPSRVRVLRC